MPYLWVTAGRIVSSVNNTEYLHFVVQSPYETDVISLIKKGKNDLIIKVTILYPNRIIGD